MKVLKKRNVILGVIAVAVLIFGIYATTWINPYWKSRQLIRAIQQKDYDAVERILESGLDPNTPETVVTKIWYLFETAPNVPIDVAAKADDLRSVRLLLQYGADPNHIEGTRSYPLHSAIFANGENVLAIVQELVEHGADPYETYANDNAFYEAADKYSKNDPAGEFRMLQTMDYLLSFFGETPQTVSEKSRSMWSLTTSSIYHGRGIQLIQYLIDHGGRIDYDSSCAGESFYDYCHREGNEDILELIEKNGGFPDERTNPDP